MSHTPFTPPTFQKEAFNCPFCNAYARQIWQGVYYHNGRSIGVDQTDVCYCTHCSKFSIWHKSKMIHPDDSGVEPSNIDMEDEIRDDYMEAASILQKSPRGAAALLRLALQKLCKQLGEKGKDINTDIGNLVQKGLPLKVQESLDSLRVIGNESVHPGQIDLRDDAETAKSLFRLINFITEKMITEPKEIDAIYNKIPDSKKEQIQKRDNPTVE